MAQNGDIVLNYHNSLLRASDVALLQPGCWLNDRVMGFVFEYLEFDMYPMASEVCLMSPEVTQFIKLSDVEDITLCLSTLQLEEKNLVLMAVNDNSSLDTPGGAHWSLLVYHRQAHSFKHYDSLVGHNRKAAHQVAKKMQSLLGTTDKHITDVLTPQQKNGSDCGVYVLAIAEELVRQYVEETKEMIKFSPEAITEKRDKLKRVIEELKVKGFGVTEDGKEKGDVEEVKANGEVAGESTENS